MHRKKKIYIQWENKNTLEEKICFKYLVLFKKYRLYIPFNIMLITYYIQVPSPKVFCISNMINRRPLLRWKWEHLDARWSSCITKISSKQKFQRRQEFLEVLSRAIKTEHSLWKINKLQDTWAYGRHIKCPFKIWRRSPALFTALTSLKPLESKYTLYARRGFQGKLLPKSHSCNIRHTTQNIIRLS